MRRGPARATGVAAAAGAALALLVGCGVSSEFVELQGDPTDDDALPAFVQSDLVDRDSARLVVERDGVRIFLSAGTEPMSPICVTLIGADLVWGSGCGRPPMEMSVPGIAVVTVGDPPPDGSEQVSENVSVRWLP